MRVELQKLILINFKGIKSLSIDFQHETKISGANATGKTTIMDAFLFLLFGKDSSDKKDFNIKTLNEKGIAISMIDHEVIGSLNIWDGDNNDLPRTMILRRSFREKWVKSRGKAETQFSGHETVFFVDQVPCSLSEYQEKVDSLCKESLFKLLTNPAYFPALNWTVQRSSLFSLIPEVSNQEIVEAIPLKAKQQGKFDELFKIINAQKSMEDYRKEIAAKKRNLNDELVLIPARIDEVHRGKPEAEDWAALEKAMFDADEYIRKKGEAKDSKLASVEAETDKRSKLQAEINTAKQKMTSIKYSVEDGIREKGRAERQKKEEHEHYLVDYHSLIQKNNNTLTGLGLDLELLQAKRQTLIDDWKAINAETYTHVVPGKCPECGQELPEDFKEKTDEINRGEWNSNKQNRIETNTKQGKNIAGQIVQKNEQIDEATAKIGKLMTDLETVKKGWAGDEVPSETMGASGASPAAISFVEQVDAALKAHEEYQKLAKSIEGNMAKLEKLGPIQAVDTSTLDKEIANARTAQLENRTKLMARDLIAKCDSRKAELEASQTKLSQQIAELEQMEFSIETFIRTKVTMLEQRINAMFSVVKFKMFDQQINGQLAEACECSIDGVPYSDLNGAGKIQAGCDIIRTLSKKYGITAPIWVDNRESVTELPEMECQIISLIVDPEDKVLRIT